MIPGETWPDPIKDSSSRRFLNDKKFIQPAKAFSRRVIVSPVSLFPTYLFCANFNDLHVHISETPALEPALSCSYVKIALTSFWDPFPKRYFPNLRTILEKKWRKREILFHLDKPHGQSF